MYWISNVIMVFQTPLLQYLSNTFIRIIIFSAKDIKIKVAIIGLVLSALIGFPLPSPDRRITL